MTVGVDKEWIVAIYHLYANTVSRSNGGGAKAGDAKDYITRTGKYKEHHPDEQRADAADKNKKYIGRAGEVLFRQSGNMPSWSSGGESDKYWSMCDKYERANGRLYKTLEYALPKELNLGRQKALVASYVKSLTSNPKLPYSFAIHRGKGTNPHCHIMISERVNDGRDRTPQTWFRRYNSPTSGGAKKTIVMRPRSWLMNARKSWEMHANRALKQAGSKERIDCRSLDAQGINRIPQIHLGPENVILEEKYIRTGVGSVFLEIETLNNKIEELRCDGVRESELKKIVNEFKKRMGRDNGNIGKNRVGTPKSKRSINGNGGCNKRGIRNYQEDRRRTEERINVDGRYFGKNSKPGDRRSGGSPVRAAVNVKSHVCIRKENADIGRKVDRIDRNNSDIIRASARDAGKGLRNGKRGGNIREDRDGKADKKEVAGRGLVARISVYIKDFASKIVKWFKNGFLNLKNTIMPVGAEKMLNQIRYNHTYNSRSFDNVKSRYTCSGKTHDDRSDRDVTCDRVISHER